MCNSVSSSQIEKADLRLSVSDPERFAKYRNLLPNKQKHREVSISDLYEWIPHLESIQIAGGEPTLNPQQLAFLNECIAQGRANDIELVVFTNCTNINKTLLDCISKFKLVEFWMSVDSIGNGLEYIRYPAKWGIIERNIGTLMEFAKTHKNIKLLCSITVQVYNMLDLDKIFDHYLSMAKLHDVADQFTISPIDLVAPVFLATTNAPPEMRKLALHRLTAWIGANSSTWFGESTAATIDPILVYLSKTHTTHMAASILDYADFDDQNKKNNLKEMLPEVYEALLLAGPDQTGMNGDV
jgi:hypothetical protein